MFMFDIVFGVRHWLLSAVNGVATTAGSVILAMLPLVMGTQFLLSRLGFDVADEPREMGWTPPTFSKWEVKYRTGAYGDGSQRARRR